VENIATGKPSASGSSDLAENARNTRNSRGMAAATNFVREQTGMNTARRRPSFGPSSERRWNRAWPGRGAPAAGRRLWPMRPVS
jgi:hypothetical protein